MSEHKIPIPSMIYNAAVGGHVTNSQQIIDENLNREQNDINQETVGAVPYATSFYADASNFAVTNVSLKASKDIKITDSFSVPVFAAVTANPSTEKAYFVFGLTLQP